MPLVISYASIGPSHLPTTEDVVRKGLVCNSDREHLPFQPPGFREAAGLGPSGAMYDEGSFVKKRSLVIEVERVAEIG